MAGPSKFMQRVEEQKRRDAEAAAAAGIVPDIKVDDDLIPDEPFQRTEAQQQLDDFIKNIDIVEAYVRFGGKTRNPNVRPGQTESIKLRCPNPQHVDLKPTFWVNRDKNVGTCAVCGGMDVKDIAAYYFDFPVPGYKDKEYFPQLMEAIAGAYGFHYERTLGGQDVVWRESVDNPDNSDISGPSPEARQGSDSPDISGKTDISGVPAASFAPSREPVSTDDPDDAPSTPISAVPDNVEELYEDGDEIRLPMFDWHQIAPGTDTFIDIYMEACRKDESPEEYHFFNALLACGFAAGRDVRLESKFDVLPNLFICALGKTGSGKSSAARHLKKVLKEVLPYKQEDPNSKGVDFITPASAEALIKAFSKPVLDPTNPKIVSFYAPVRGLVDFSEMSSLIGRANRLGNILKPTLMQFYDGDDHIVTQSNTGGRLIASDSFCSATTTAQPRALRDLLRDNDDASGFLNRWVFVAGTRKENTIMGTGPVELGPAIKALQEIRGWAGSFTGKKKITWTPEALGRLQLVLQGPVQELKDNPDTDIFTRMDLLLQKLCLLLTINKKEREVSNETVSQVLTLLPYLRNTYAVIADQLGSTLEDDITQAIIYQIKRIGGNGGATLNGIAKALKRKKYPKELILRNIKSLIELGFVEERTGDASTRGRPTKKYACVA